MQEGAILRLEVKRERGTFGDVHVGWRLTATAGIVNASSQISPMNGSLTFKQVCGGGSLLNFFEMFHLWNKD